MFGRENESTTGVEALVFWHVFKLVKEQDLLDAVVSDCVVQWSKFVVNRGDVGIVVSDECKLVFRTSRDDRFGIR